MILVGIDWSEEWHDVCLMDEGGRVLGRRRIDDSPAGLTQLQSLIAEHAEEPAEVAIGIETPHGLLVRALQAAGYTIYAVNPLAASRYRDRYAVSKKKSDRGDAMMLADLVRTDRHRHRQLGEDSEPGEAIKVLARSHKSLIWTRQQLGNQLRSALHEFYPGISARPIRWPCWSGLRRRRRAGRSRWPRSPPPSAGLAVATSNSGRPRSTTRCVLPSWSSPPWWPGPRGWPQPPWPASSRTSSPGSTTWRRSWAPP